MPDGSIAFRLRVGVTGHRVLDDEDWLAARVREALVLVRRRVGAEPATPVHLTVVSSLAEGADRLVAQQILREEEGALLEVPLPLPRDRYRSDFATQSSVDEFDELLERAVTVIEPGPLASAEDGYAEAGRYVVERSDVLLALWDGLPARGEGGTAEIVDYAGARKKPTVWIHTGGDLEIDDRLDASVARHALERLDEFNRATVSPQGVSNRLEDLRRLDESSGADATEAIGREAADALSAWILPYLIRADVLALRYQRWFHRLTLALYFAAAAAVAVVAVQSFVFPGQSAIVWIEVALLTLLVAVVFYGRRIRLHDRWLSYRFLAERFRSAFFLAAAGLGQRREGGLARVGGREAGVEWVQHAFTEVWNGRPKVDVHPNVERLRAFLAERWIGEQRRYYARARLRFDRRRRLLVAAIYCAFLTTIAAAVPHALGVGEERGIDKLFAILSLSLPALGAAFSGLLAQREYQRNSERYRWMEQSLDVVANRMSQAHDELEIRRIAADAEATLLQENRDWMGVMRFHDFELS